MKTIMIRRRKADVLTQLPPKTRTIVRLELDPGDRRQLDQVFSDMGNNRAIREAVMQRFQGVEGGQGSGGSREDAWKAHSEHQQLLTQAFQVTGVSKAQACGDYVLRLLQGGGDDMKIIVFAHHRKVMDMLDQIIRRKKISLMRIDGETPVSERGRLVTRFQEDPKLRVALLSITAAGRCCLRGAGYVRV